MSTPPPSISTETCTSRAVHELHEHQHPRKEFKFHPVAVLFKKSDRPTLSPSCKKAKLNHGTEHRTRATTEEHVAPFTVNHAMRQQHSPSTPSQLRTSPLLPPPNEFPSIPDVYDTHIVNVAIATMLAALQGQPSNVAEQMYRFLQRSYELAQWSQEANIAACVLVMRWITKGNVLCPQSWKSVLLIALLVAQKITDDIPLATKEFCTIWQAVSEEPELISVADLTKLESNFVQSLDWRVFVDSKTMTTVYYELMACQQLLAMQAQLQEQASLCSGHGNSE
jgi:hypothetical protein